MFNQPFMTRNPFISICLFFAVMFLFTACKQKDTVQTTTAKETILTDSIPPKTEINPVPFDTLTNDTINKNKMKTEVNAPLRIVIDNLANNDGEVEIGVYTPKNKFPDEKDKFKKYRFKPKHRKIDESITDLPYGEFAFAVYHDENNSGEIDKNLIGIPKERYAFSNNIKPTFKAPNFEDCKFNYDKNTDVIRISLLK